MAEEDPRRYLRRRAGWKVDEDGAGARFKRRGSAREGLVRRIDTARAMERWHAAVMQDGHAVYVSRWYDLDQAVAWVEAHR